MLPPLGSGGGSHSDDCPMVQVTVVLHLQDPYWNTQEDREFYLELVGQTARDLGVSRLHLVDQTDGKIEPYYMTDVKLAYFKTLDDALDAAVGEVVYLEAPVDITKGGLDATCLTEFEHPGSNVVYVIGPEVSTGPIAPKDANIVTIESTTKYTFWSHIAMTMVLYDRMSKRSKLW